MKLLFAAFLFICLGSLAQGKVLKFLRNIICRNVFVDGQQPLFNGKYKPDESKTDQYRFICQRVSEEKDHDYVTLYDTMNRIPIYSAYLYFQRAPGTKIHRASTWKIEPELDHGKYPCMTTEAKSGVAKDLGEKQAVNKDYEGSGYDRGHLYPVNHAHDQDAADGTFTLTNAAPQNCMFNKEWHNKVEKVVSKELDKCPKGNAYVVTGVKPGDKYINGRVNVPSYFWTAYCCKGEFSHAFIMYEDLRLEHISLKEFQKYTNIEPFGGKCV